MYKNERAQSFEVFSSQMKKAVDILADCKRPPHDADIVDGLWNRIQNIELQPFISALKVQHQLNPRPFRSILQDIASQVPNLTSASRSFRANISQISVTDNNMDVVEEGDSPEKGAYTSDGRLFIGSYSNEQ